MSSVMRFDEWQDSNGVPVASGAGGVFSAPGSILQVVSTAKTDSFTSTATTYTDITGLTVSITPKSATSKIFVTASLSGMQQVGTNQTFLRLARGGTGILQGTAAGSRSVAAVQLSVGDASASAAGSIMFLDSPASTSALTYSIQGRVNGGTYYINRSMDDVDNNGYPRTVSTITVMEIAG